MAAIIAQITRANRERQKRKRLGAKVGKCMNHKIEYFDAHFDPKVSY